MYSAVDISKYVINKCIKDNRPVNNYRLQKILYFIQKSYIKSGMKAFDDPIEAWQFGPVIPNSYYSFYHSGISKITTTFDVDIKKDDREIIDTIIEDLYNVSTWQLFEKSHKPGGAWDITYKRGRNWSIDDELIKAEDD